MLHFVGFRGDEYLRAVCVFGKPDFIHQGYDLRVRRECLPSDTVVFAKGSYNQKPSKRSFNDINE